MAKAYLEVDEVMRLEQAANNLRDRILIRFLFNLECRIFEVLGVTVDDIDLGASTITIKHLKARVRLSCPDCGAKLSKSHAYCPKCRIKVVKVVAEENMYHQMKKLPIDPDTQMMLKEYIERGGPVIRGGKRLIFGIGRCRAWQIIKQCAEEARLPRLKNSNTGKLHNISPCKLRNAYQRLQVKDKS